MKTYPSCLPHVLFVTYTVPWSPRYGGAMRCFGVIRGLAERSNLHVALANSTPQATEAFMTWPAPSGITRHVLSPDARWEAVDDWVAGRRLQARLGFSKYRASLRALEHSLRPDLVWYFEIESLRRGGWPSHTPVVLDHCDVRWRKTMRLARIETGAHQARILIRAALLCLDDIQLALRVKHALVASPEESSLLWPARRVSVLPNGFDFPALPPVRPEDGHRLLFFGALFYKPNLDGVRWLCQEIWPLVKSRIPDAQLDVVGLGKEALEDLVDTPGVTFHGFVEDLAPLIGQAAALVVPLRVGGGTRIKILEAWASGLSVVSTTIGAEGLEARDGETLLLGDTAPEFAQRCVAVLQDDALRQRLGAAGYAHGRARFDWPVVNAAIGPLLAQCLRG